MGIGAPEVILLGIVAVPVGLVAALTGRLWVLGILACFAVAAAFTPPDALSTLLLGVPMGVVYALAVVALAGGRGRRAEPPADRDATLDG